MKKFSNRRIKCFRQIGPSKIHGIYLKQVREAIDSLASFTHQIYTLRSGLDEIAVLDKDNNVIVQNKDPHKVVEGLELIEMDTIANLLETDDTNNEIFEFEP